jgi:cytidine deaminase
MTTNFGYFEYYPPLVFGLAGPIGADLEYIEECLCDSLTGFGYSHYPIRITKLMQDVECELSIDESTSYTGYDSKICYANRLREKYGDDILAALAISAIRSVRLESKNDPSKSGEAFVIRQLKTPDEVKLLRSVYGKQFIQISVYSDEKSRIERLSAKIRITSHGTIDEQNANKDADKLVKRDQKEDLPFGQNLRDVFPMGDLFVDSNDRIKAASQIARFLDAVFGSNQISPTREEYAMYLAKSASLRSSDLSRQVGAAIFSNGGEIVSLGSNEVPKAGGGTYWTGEPRDARDFQKGHDPNEINKIDVFADIINRMFDDSLLSNSLMELTDKKHVVEHLLSLGGGRRYKDSRIMDIIEFGRIIHAEMSAICDAARNGASIKDGTLYCTTFPCHLCAKHIVASGIKCVVYLEPYPKSHAISLHGDSISLDGSDDNKVHFKPFMGIAPSRYRDLFEKGKRKLSSGEASKWQSEPRRPLINYISSPSAEAESWVSGKLSQLLTKEIS